MLRKLIGVGAVALTVAAFGTGTAQARSLDQIKKAGTLVVGVKADYRPFGFRDSSGQIIGFGPDLAKDVADRMGVKLQLVPVVASNRMQFLEQGKIDLMIATMNDTPERRKIVGIVQPDYYASGLTVLAKKKANLNSWDDIKGKPICAIQGSWYNKPVTEKYGPRIIAFKGTAEAQTALLQGNCIGWIYDNTAFAGLLADKATWGNYETPLPTIMEAPWGAAVPLDQLDKPLGHFISDVITKWHQSGKIIALEKKWDLPPSPWVAEQHKKFKTASKNK
jgi:polar amino acid transport system substrate-binding protein